MTYSIIIPVYNVAPYLRECLDSVLSQTYPGWECLCVNDGSTDESGAILDEYAKKDARFRIFHKKNGGVSSARNVALAGAKGPYITFIDGDDSLLPQWFECAQQAIEVYQPDLVRQQLQFWKEETLLPAIGTSVCQVYRTREEILTWGARMFVLAGFAGLCFVKRSSLEGIAFDPRLRVKEDCLFYLSLLPRLECVVQTDYAGYLYRYRAVSAIHALRPKEQYFAFTEAALELWQRQGMDIQRYRALAQMLSYAIVLDLIECVQYYGHREKGLHRTIVQYYRRLKSTRLLSFKQVHGHWVIAFWIYLFTGIQWPIRLLKCITRFRVG